MARISLDPPRGISLRIAEWYSRRKYGKAMDPVRAVAHNPKVLSATLLYESRIAKWRDLDPGLKHLAEMVSAARIGCSWCVDFGYWLAEDLGMPMEKIQYVPAWREHRERFTELELLVMEFAEAMTDTEPTVTDEMAEALIGRLGKSAFVELTAMVAVENSRSRINAALGLTGQGFSDQCAVRPVQKGERGAATS
ncbi:carboxymuconolactone decarboxylase [Streptomyces abyssalis]|uniref:Carboxymuconolactone decarboxylase n=1 Tax=Streptomyces abyssalis TaxID=933944 RepID=A0A1E7JLG6_9ACTN|nr:carboxymuconolactone decarboxylase family protein [Streptomyces abyssalis]OEU88449.1 carboxymuconolactone decarboxylase [Streptomyces abyssalis]OEU89187.1 carboxymuconolactone decarboxylase [Streptomyces abyssalis]OEV09082.1 carboxymuconolactone decarboxylase [Streptomyces nanshensis]